DDNSATTTLDGGSGYDLFQIGQIFGNKRDSFNTEGALLPQDTFPALVATTRGWLSPGTHLPLYATGGTGNDEFVVYSNQAELRLDGDDDNDLFVIRAFALAAVCDTSTDGDSDCDWNDVNIVANETTGAFPAANPATHVCDMGTPTTADDRKDNNHDNVCNNADAEMTRDDDFHTTWEDDVIPLNPATGAASPKIGLGFAVARPLDIRAGGGDDEVQYNVTAPVSVDGGTGFDKLVVLATEFADDIVITERGIFGAGLNVRAVVEVIEVDGLEGDDEFFILSTAFGTAYRVIGGLGSDTINVTSDVTEDIVTRELEGLMGTIDFRMRSLVDAQYNGLPVDGIDYNLATPDTGVVVITENGSGTQVREGGSVAVPTIDYYTVALAADPGANNVYVTVSAARSPQEEADNSFANPAPLPNGNADTLWMCLGNGTVGDCSSMSQFQRHKIVNGVLVDENGRAVVLTFLGGGAGNWATPQRVYLFAPDDPRSEGERIVVTQHSVISANPLFDRARVRNVEVMVRDNDTPGVMVTPVQLGTTIEDRGTIVVEGSNDPAAGGAYTGTDDDLLVQLAKAPEGTDTIVVRL